MRIVYVESGYPCPHGGGGAGTYVQLVSRELVRRGNGVRVVSRYCPQCKQITNDEGVTVYRLKKGNLHWLLGKATGLKRQAIVLRYLESGWTEHRFIQRLHGIEPIDIVEFSEGGDFWHRFAKKIPYVSHLHGSRYTFLASSGRCVGKIDWYHRWLELEFIRRADYVISPSMAMLKLVEGELGMEFRRKRCIPYPLDPDVENAASSRNGERIDNMIFFAARNDPVKGGDVLLKAADIVQKRMHDVTFHFYGFMPKPETDVPSNVLCHNFLPKKELLSRLRKATICVIPSYWDNSPNTVYEAMAVGKAVVASKVGGIPELVVDGDTGILVDAGDYVGLANAIIELLLDHKKRADMGKRGRLRILSLASLAQNVDRRLVLYEEMAGEHWLSSRRGQRSRTIT